MWQISQPARCLHCSHGQRPATTEDDARAHDFIHVRANYSVSAKSHTSQGCSRGVCVANLLAQVSRNGSPEFNEANVCM